jgi:PadR family transcriptional regulator, regulatory protein PadR
VADLKPQIIVAACRGRNRGTRLLQSCRLIEPIKAAPTGHRRLIYNVTYMQPFPFGAILGEFELLVLLALLRLGNGAYGAAIHREIMVRTGRDVPVSAVYVTLERLERKRMVCSYIGTSRQQRGGRRRKHYLLDTAGQRALVRAYRTISLMTAGLQPEIDDLAYHVSPATARATAPRRGW